MDKLPNKITYENSFYIITLNVNKLQVNKYKKNKFNLDYCESCYFFGNVIIVEKFNKKNICTFKIKGSCG